MSVKGVVLGVAFNDSDHPVIRKIKGKVVWKCPYYKRWYKILTRCYDKTSLRDNPSYKGVTVCDEWLHFSNFEMWMKCQIWGLEDKTLLHIDKDLLVSGSKVYSPDTCTFLHPKVNNFMTECKKGKAFEDIGFKKRVYPSGEVVYQARCCNPFNVEDREADSLGVFKEPLDAHLAWKTRKLHYANKLINEGYTLDKEQEIALIRRYT